MQRGVGGKRVTANYRHKQGAAVLIRAELPRYISAESQATSRNESLVPCDLACAVYGIAANWRAQVAVTRRRAVTTRPPAAAGMLCRAGAATSAFGGVSAVVQS